MTSPSIPGRERTLTGELQYMETPSGTSTGFTTFSSEITFASSSEAECVTTGSSFSGNRLRQPQKNHRLETISAHRIILFFILPYLLSCNSFLLYYIYTHFTMSPHGIYPAADRAKKLQKNPISSTAFCILIFPIYWWLPPGLRWRWSRRLPLT